MVVKVIVQLVAGSVAVQLSPVEALIVTTPPGFSAASGGVSLSENGIVTACPTTEGLALGTLTVIEVASPGQTRPPAVPQRPVPPLLVADGGSE